MYTVCCVICYINKKKPPPHRQTYKSQQQRATGIAHAPSVEVEHHSARARRAVANTHRNKHTYAAAHTAGTHGGPWHRPLAMHITWGKLASSI